MKNELLLRDFVSDDLPIFFEQQLNQEASYMAAFTAKDPTKKPLSPIICTSSQRQSRLASSLGEMRL